MFKVCLMILDIPLNLWQTWASFLNIYRCRQKLQPSWRPFISKIFSDMQRATRTAALHRTTRKCTARSFWVRCEKHFWSGTQSVAEEDCFPIASCCLVSFPTPFQSRIELIPREQNATLLGLWNPRKRFFFKTEMTYLITYEIPRTS